MTDDTFSARIEGNRIAAGIISDLQRQLAEAQAERDEARGMLIAMYEGGEGLPSSMFRKAREWSDAKRHTDLIDAITQALIADPRAFVEVYAEVVQGERWAGLWGSLSVGERSAIVAQARKEAGR